MKKVLALILALALVFALAACGNKTDNQTPNNQTPSNQTPDNQTPDDQTPGDDQTPEVTWPNGEIKILAGYSVGSLTDVNIHTIADWITAKTGAKVTIENNDVGGGANLANELVAAEPDGQTLMVIGMNTISNYYNGTWAVNPADSSKFKIACGFIQPDPDSGCMILTQANAPYSTWDELAAYAEEHPGEVTVASIAGKVMDIKMKAIFNGTGLSSKIRWVSTDNAGATAGLLGDNIDLVMLDEATACSYLKDGSCKAIINCRYLDDYTGYEEGEDKDLIMSVPTLKDVFGAEGENYMVPNRSMFCVPAGTPDEIVAQICAIVDELGNETEGEWYERCTANGGTSIYRTWDGKEVMTEWERLDPVIKEIVEMG